MKISSPAVKRFIGIGVVLIVCFILVLILLQNTQKEKAPMKFGMTSEEVISILEKDGCEYFFRDISTLEDDNKQLLTVTKGIQFCGIEGGCSVYFKADKAVDFVFVCDLENLDEKVEKLGRHLTKSYGEAHYFEELSTVMRKKHYEFYKDNLIVTFGYPEDENGETMPNISVVWRQKVEGTGIEVWRMMNENKQSE